MSDSRRIRISSQSGIERITMPSDCVIEFVIERGEFVAGYSGNSPIVQSTSTPVLFVKRGEDVLARFTGVTSWRDESIVVEKGAATPSGLTWTETG